MCTYKLVPRPPPTFKTGSTPLIESTGGWRYEVGKITEAEHHQERTASPD